MSTFSLLAPFRAPGKVFAYSSSSTAVIVVWSHLSEEDFQGQPIGYNITYYLVDLEGDVNFVRVNFTTNSTTLTNLAVYVLYVINVSAVSSGGIGPANIVQARTDAAGRDGSSVPKRKITTTKHSLT